MTEPKIEVKVGEGFDAIARRVTDVWHKAERGEHVEPEIHIAFQDWNTFSSVITPKRVQLLRHLHRRPARSVAALARDLERDYKRVHEDVEALSTVGLISREDGSLRADYDEIRTTIAM
jgi:predicted transcriptional regulator